MYYNRDSEYLSFLVEEENQPVNLKGLYKVFIESDEVANLNMQEVQDCLYSHRNLCEDYEEIKVLDTQNIFVKAEVEIGEVEDVNLLLANIYSAIATFISPRIPFYTKDEMLAKGKRIDEIMDGPVLERGFINTEDLESFTRKTELRTSDIINEVSDVEGVVVVKNITVGSGSQEEEWVLSLDAQKTPKFDVSTTQITLVRHELEASVDYKRAKELYDSQSAIASPPVLDPQKRDIVLETSENRHAGDYYSIQKDFPNIYGIGELGLPESATDKRKGQAKQLKAYLLFFEQLLANYFAQISHVKELFSFNHEEKNSYFTQVLSDVRAWNKYYRKKTPYNTSRTCKNLVESEETALGRKNRFLNHLLARFAEEFTDYSLLLYGLVAEEENSASSKLIQDKTHFLMHYPKLSAGRATAFNYTKAGWDTTNISGLEKRMGSLLGIKNDTRRSLLDDYNTVKGEIAALFDYKLYNIQDVLRCGLSTPNFSFNAATNKIDLADDNSTVIASSIATYTEANSTAQIQSYTTQWHDWSRKLEGFHFVEHILLRPRQNGTDAFLDFGQDITAFALSTAGSDRTTCTSEKHNLENGEEVEVAGTSNYNGTYRIRNVTEDTFDIEKTFVVTETGSWKSALHSQDPYSLQLSVILPHWPVRFRDPNYKKFVEKVVREETPAHVEIFIHWMSSSGDMPTSSWVNDDIRAYMTKHNISYANDDTKDQLLAKIPQTGTYIEDFESLYKTWLEKMQTGAEDIFDVSNDMAELLKLGKTALLTTLHVHSGSQIVNSGTATTIDVLESQQSATYQLYTASNNTTVGSPVTGTGATISLPTNNISSETSFYVEATKLLSGIKAVLTQQPTIFINSLGYTASADKVTVTGYKAISSDSSRTAEAWIKTTATNAAIVSWGQNSAGKKWTFRVQNTNGTAGAIRVEVNSGYIVGTTVVNDGQWHHVACVFDKENSTASNVQQVKLFVDGKEEQISSSSSRTLNTGTTADLCIGNDFSNRYFNGHLADVRVWSIARTEAQIHADMHRRLAGSETGLEVYLKMDEGTGTALNDSTSNNRDGALTGGAWA